MPASVLTMVGLKFPNLFSIIMLSGGVERRGVSIQLQLVSRKKLFVEIYLCCSFPRSTRSTYGVLHVSAQLHFKFFFSGGTCRLYFLVLWFINGQNHFLSYFDE